jgi:hypothetical protein
MLNLIRRRWFCFFAAVPIVTFLLLGFFTGPTLDDFCYAGALMKMGFLEALQDNYLNWQGRYASSSILFLSAYLDRSSFLTWYWLISTSLILATLFSAYILINTINKFALQSTLTRAEIATASAVLTSIYLISLDRPGEVIYWFSGSVTYPLANVLLTLWLAILIRLYFAETSAKKFVLFTASAVLMVLIIGHNETAMAVTLSSLALVVVCLNLSHDKDRFRGYKALLEGILVIGILASLVVILAPGNRIRIEEEKVWGMNPAHSIPEFLQAGLSTLIWIALSSLRWMTTQPYHCFAILLAHVATSRFPRPVQEYIENKSLLWIPVIGFGGMCAASFTSFYLGIVPPLRARAGIYIVFWLTFIPSGLILLRRSRWNLRGRGVVTTLQIALVGSVLLHPHYPQSTQEFKDTVLYRLQLEERERLVSNALHDGYRDVVVPKLMRLPATIHYRDLSEDKSHNICYASYRGIDSIVARGDGDPSRLVRDLKQMVISRIHRVISSSPW